MSQAEGQKLPPEAHGVLTRTTLRAADLLKISQRDLAQILGVSQPKLTAISRHGALLPADPKRLELAALFLRVYRSLDAISGGEDGVSRAWLRNPNTALGDIPLNRMKTIDGLVGVLAYLDQRRAPL